MRCFFVERRRSARGGRNGRGLRAQRLHRGPAPAASPAPTAFDLARQRAACALTVAASGRAAPAARRWPGRLALRDAASCAGRASSSSPCARVRVAVMRESIYAPRRNATPARAPSVRAESGGLLGRRVGDGRGRRRRGAAARTRAISSRSRCSTSRFQDPVLHLLDGAEDGVERILAGADRPPPPRPPRPSRSRSSSAACASLIDPERTQPPHLVQALHLPLREPRAGRRAGAAPAAAPRELVVGEAEASACRLLAM